MISAGLNLLVAMAFGVNKVKERFEEIGVMAG